MLELEYREQVDKATGSHMVGEQGSTERKGHCNIGELIRNNEN